MRIALLLVVACSSGSKPHDPGSAPSPVEKDPWATTSAPTGSPGPAAKNINKLVIGGDNTKPQMGLFALARADADKVDAEMKQGLEPAYRLAQKLAVKAWTGDRNFCEDAVRQTIGYFGIDGMLDPSDLRAWKTAKLADVRDQLAAAINERHVQMIGERDEAACDKTLAIYVEGLQLAAAQQLELRNFGY
jgi:hypothetical protein